MTVGEERPLSDIVAERAAEAATFASDATELADQIDAFVQRVGMDYIGANMREFAVAYAAALRNLVSIYNAAWPGVGSDPKPSTPKDT